MLSEAVPHLPHLQNGHFLGRYYYCPMHVPIPTVNRCRCLASVCQKEKKIVNPFHRIFSLKTHTYVRWPRLFNKIRVFYTRTLN